MFDRVGKRIVNAGHLDRKIVKGDVQKASHWLNEAHHKCKLKLLSKLTFSSGKPT